MLQLRLKLHWSLFPRVQLTIFQHWFRKWLGAVQTTSHYLNQWWSVYRRIYASLALAESKGYEYQSRSKFVVTIHHYYCESRNLHRTPRKGMSIYNLRLLISLKKTYLFSIVLLCCWRYSRAYHKSSRWYQIFTIELRIIKNAIIPFPEKRTRGTTFVVSCYLCHDDIYIVYDTNIWSQCKFNTEVEFCNQYLKIIKCVPIVDHIYILLCFNPIWGTLIFYPECIMAYMTFSVVSLCYGE